MRVVYVPSNLIDAHVVKGVLEQYGIPVYLRGEHLAGGIGELPVLDLYALCVPEAFEAEATAVMEDLLRERMARAGAEDEADDAGWAGVPA